MSDKKIIEYNTVHDHDHRPGTLDGIINQMIQQGWELYGDPYTTSDREGDGYYHQAMVKRDA